MTAPCPFCLYEKPLLKKTLTIDGYEYRIECPDCGALGPLVTRQTCGDSLAWQAWSIREKRDDPLVSIR